MGYCSWGRKESGTTECAHTQTLAHSHNRVSNMILFFQITLSDQIKNSSLNELSVTLNKLPFQAQFCFTFIFLSKSKVDQRFSICTLEVTFACLLYFQR